jgi:MFS family permease
MFSFPRNVWLLGWVSLATDSATEAIYPLLPYFLTHVLRAGAVSLGIVEGAAEAVNSILKIASGRMADRAPRKRPLVLFGYSVSSIARPFIAITTTWTQVFAVRVLDRVGKGVRGAPRDVMLAAVTPPGRRGAVFGFHRAMDNLGAVAGPLLATSFLYFYPDRYRALFGLTIVPGALAIALILLVREAPRGAEVHGAGVHGAEVDGAGVPGAGGHVAPLHLAPGTVHPAPLHPAPRVFVLFMIVLTIFTLGNSTDAFLLLKLTDAAGTAKYIPAMWAALNFVKAVISVVGGSWSDRIGRKQVIGLGWLVYAIVYAGFAFTSSLGALFAWLLVYGFYFGFAEGTEKALVADLAPAESRGTAFGIYTAVQGVGALAASVIFGVVWTAYGTAAAFGLGAALALLATGLLFIIVR